jgi:hypothetical protein
LDQVSHVEEPPRRVSQAESAAGGMRFEENERMSAKRGRASDFVNTLKAIHLPTVAAALNQLWTTQPRKGIPL